MSDNDEKFVDYKIEMLFEYPTYDDSQYLDWAHGVVSKIINVKTRRVEIEWDSACVA